jgi:hypothetical protein
MKYCITFFLIVSITSTMAQNQSRLLVGYFSDDLIPQTSGLSSQKSSGPHFFSGDKPLTFRPKSPMMLASNGSFKSESYWMSSMTTQSYNQGKLGTYYYWDVQNNLAESRMFVDIAGKNKRGLKLVFRRR